MFYGNLTNTNMLLIQITQAKLWERTTNNFKIYGLHNAFVNSCTNDLLSGHRSNMFTAILISHWLVFPCILIYVTDDAFLVKALRSTSFPIYLIQQHADTKIIVKMFAVTKLRIWYLKFKIIYVIYTITISYPASAFLWCFFLLKPWNTVKCLTWFLWSEHYKKYFLVKFYGYQYNIVCNKILQLWANVI